MAIRGDEAIFTKKKKKKKKKNNSSSSSTDTHSLHFPFIKKEKELTLEIFYVLMLFSYQPFRFL